MSPTPATSIPAEHPLPAIPDPRLELVKNLTPFPHLHCQKMGPGRRFFDTVVLKGTFVLAPGPLRIAEEQAPIVLADRYRDRANAARSSLEHAGEVLLRKPGTDVMITGSAHAPRGRPLTEWDCTVTVHGHEGAVLGHTVQATGPRQFVHRALRGWTLSDPEPALVVPIRYELAYGGSFLDRRSPPGSPRFVVYRPNPSGRGFFDDDTLDSSRTYPGPQWQLRAHPVKGINTEVPLAGLGPVARMWSARKRFAGTYDSAWQERLGPDAAKGLCPDYPADFDLRFFQCAHPALVTPAHLRGDERIRLLGLVSGRDAMELSLPNIQPRAKLFGPDGARDERPMDLDTVHVDLDTARVHLCWRLALGDEQDFGAAAIVAETGERHGQTHR